MTTSCRFAVDCATSTVFISLPRSTDGIPHLTSSHLRLLPYCSLLGQNDSMSNSLSLFTCTILSLSRILTSLCAPEQILLSPLLNSLLFSLGQVYLESNLRFRTICLRLIQLDILPRFSVLFSQVRLMGGASLGQDPGDPSTPPTVSVSCKLP